MQALTVKHSEEALAFWTLFKTMTPEVKEEVYKILTEEANINDEVTTDMMTAMSLDSFQQVWDSPENEHWDNFIKDRLQCTNKEI